MKFEISLTKEEVNLAKFTRLDDVRFRIELTVCRKHFVDILSKFVETVEV